MTGRINKNIRLDTRIPRSQFKRATMVPGLSG